MKLQLLHQAFILLSAIYSISTIQNSVSLGSVSLLISVVCTTAKFFQTFFSFDQRCFRCLSTSRVECFPHFPPPFLLLHRACRMISCLKAPVSRICCPFLCIFRSPTYNRYEIAALLHGREQYNSSLLHFISMFLQASLNGWTIISGLTMEPDIHIQNALYMMY